MPPCLGKIMKVPFTNHEKVPVCIGSKWVQPGETREVDSDMLPPVEDPPADAPPIDAPAPVVPPAKSKAKK